MHFDGAIRRSDSHLLMAFHTAADASTDSIKTYDLSVSSIATPTISSAGDVVANQTESGGVSVFIDQNTDDVYVAYGKGNPTWNFTIDVVYHKSSDGMSNWSAENAYSETGADDVRVMPAGRTGTTAGGWYQPAFYNDDLFDIFVNLVNDVEIVIVSAASSFRNEFLSPILFDLPFGNLAPVPSSVFAQEEMISFARKYSLITLSTVVVAAVNRALTLMGVGQ